LLRCLLLLHLWLLDGLHGGHLVWVLADYPGEVHFELGFGRDPECPINQFKKLGFQKIHLWQRDAANEGQEMVAVENIVVEL
jgi:hypothetical protein